MKFTRRKLQHIKAKSQKITSKNWLLIKNTLKDAWKLKAQLLGLIILLILCGFIITTVSISTNRLFKNYNELNTESRLHDFISDFNNINITTKVASKSQLTSTSRLSGAYSYIQERYKQEVLWKLATDSKLFYHQGETPLFDYNRIESRNLSLGDNISIKVIGYNPQQKVDKLIITKGQGLSSEIVTNKTGSTQPIPDKAKNARGVVLSQKFAQLNNIQIGDTIRLQPDVYGDSILVGHNSKLAIFNQASVKNNFNTFNQIMNKKYPGFSWFQVRGFGVSANMVSPIINPTIGLVNQKLQGVVYINNSNFGLYASLQNATRSIRAGPQHRLWEYNANMDRVPSYSGDQEVTYVGKFNPDFYKANPAVKNVNQAINLINKQLIHGVNIKDNNQNLTVKFQNQSLKTKKIVYPLGDKNYIYNNRTALLTIALKTYNIICYLLLLFIIIVTAVATLLITQKRIEHARQQLGVLKASGYGKSSLMIPFLSYPVLTCLIGGTLGFIGGIGLQSIPISFFYRYFNLLPTSFIFDWKSWFFSIIISFLIIGFETIVLTLLMLRNRPIELLVNHNVLNSTSSGLGRVLKKLATGTSFKNRIKVSMFTSSIGKMTTIFFTMFAGTIIMSFALVGPKIISDNLKRSFYGNNYNNAVYYRSPDWNVPTTFLKTYNPNLKPWGSEVITHQAFNQDEPNFFPNMTDLINGIAAQSINPQYYAFNPSLNSKDLTYSNLQNLTYRLFNLSDFKNNILYQPAIQNPLAFLILTSSWPDYANLVNTLNGIKSLKNPIIYTSQGQKLTWSTPKSSEDINLIYQTLARFYREYYQTLLMSINPNYLTPASKPKNPFQANQTVVWQGQTGDEELSTDNKTGYLTTNGTKPVRQNDFKIYNHMLDSKNFGTNTQQLNETQYILENQSPPSDQHQQTTINLIQDMAQWFNVTFAARAYTGVLQGIYSREPYYIRQKFLKGLQNNKEFNLGFNIIPYNPKNDYLGVYVPATINNTAIKLMGLTPNQHMVTLCNTAGTNINKLLFNQKQSSQQAIPVIINNAAAEKMGLKINQKIEANTFFSQINGSFNAEQAFGLRSVKEYNWPTNAAKTSGTDLAKDWTMEAGGSSEQLSGYLQQTMFYQNLKYQNAQPFKGNMDLTAGIGPSAVADAVHQHTTTLKNVNQKTNLKIVGIYGGYGEPRAYISNQNAMSLMHYNLSESVLFKLFLANWTKANTSKIQGAQSNAILTEIEKIKSYQQFLTLLNNKNAPNHKQLLKINTLFNALNPIFNYKLTTDSQLVDVNKSYTVSDFYGDYTPISLNGGFYAKNKVNYTRTGTAALSLIESKKMITETLLSLSTVADIVFIFFSIVSFLISLIIISLATSLVISENEYYINSLKILGYTNLEILKIVTGMYIPLIVTAFGAGFPLAWFVLVRILHTVALKSSWVFPLLFVWWLPVIVGGVIFGIYLITYFLAWLRLKQTRMLDVVNPSK